MTDVPLEQIQELFDRLAKVLDGKPDTLIRATLANAVAASAMAAMDNGGHEPYSVARNIYKNAKEHIKNNLASRQLATTLPKGARRH